MAFLALVSISLLAGCTSTPASQASPTATEPQTAFVEPTPSPTPVETAPPTPSPSPMAEASEDEPSGLPPELDFSLKDHDGEDVVLSELLKEHTAVALVFYRGFF